MRARRAAATADMPPPRTPFRTRRRNGPVAGVVLWMLITHGAIAQDSSLALAVKAAFMIKFLPFVQWPETAFVGVGGPLTLCVVGRDPFGDLLDRAAAGQSAGNHPLVVRRLPIVTRENSGCQVVFAGGSPEQPVMDVLAATRGAPVLTVTDEATDPRLRGIVNFVINDSRVRFEIDAGAAAQNGLTVSSKLLSLAVRVFGGR